jgi:hypothetical protein
LSSEAAERRRPDVTEQSHLGIQRDCLDTLEDFVSLGGPGGVVILPRAAPSSLLENTRAAVVASNGRIGLDYALRRYVSGHPASKPPAVYVAFQEAYFAGKQHMKETSERFRSGPEPSAGAVCAEAALARLPATYFAAGLLLRTGHLYEAHAVLRLLVEQVAWAFGVSEATSEGQARGTSVTKSVSRLREVLPYVGPLYGLLSSKTHMGLESHYGFLDWSGEYVKVKLTHGTDAWAVGWILLQAADAWAVAYERTQLPFMISMENWVGEGPNIRLRPDRPFLKRARELRERLTAAIEAG